MRAGLVLLLTACGPALGTARPPEPPPAPEAVGGLWRLSDSSGVVMQVALVAGAPQLEAWSVPTATEPAVRFEVSGVAWDGAARRLGATFTYPVTHTTTRSELVLVNADRLEGTVSGPYRGRETWVRIPPSDLAGVTGSGSDGTPRTPP